jgi:hypothetical protein
VSLARGRRHIRAPHHRAAPTSTNRAPLPPLRVIPTSVRRQARRHQPALGRRPRRMSTGLPSRISLSCCRRPVPAECHTPSPPPRAPFKSPFSSEAKGSLSFLSGCCGASAFTRSSARYNYTGSGFAHQSVPSLSKVAMRSAGGTKSGEPSFVTFSTKVVRDCFAGPHGLAGLRRILLAHALGQERGRIGLPVWMVARRG